MIPALPERSDVNADRSAQKRARGYREITALYFLTLFAAAPLIAVTALFVGEGVALALSAGMGAIAALVVEAVRTIRQLKSDTAAKRKRSELAALARALLRNQPNAEGAIDSRTVAATKLDDALSILREQGLEETDATAELIARLIDARTRYPQYAPAPYDMQTWFSGDSRWAVANEVLHDAMLHLIASDDDEATRGAVAMLEIASRRQASVS